MGGKFYVNNNNIPCFSVDRENPIEEEIVTRVIPGMKIVVNSSPRELIPGQYLYIGTIPSFVKFTKIVSYTRDYVETYAGEFRLAPGASIAFPSSITWDENSYGDLKSTGTYQYIIQNGLGRLVFYPDVNQGGTFECNEQEIK